MRARRITLIMDSKGEETALFTVLKKGYFYLFCRYQNDPFVQALFDYVIVLSPTIFPEKHERFLHFFSQLTHLGRFGDGELNLISSLFFKGYLGIRVFSSEISYFCYLYDFHFFHIHSPLLQKHSESAENFFGMLVGEDVPRILIADNSPWNYLSVFYLLEYSREELMLGELIKENAANDELLSSSILSTASTDNSFDRYLISIESSPKMSLKNELGLQRSFSKIIAENGSPEFVDRIAQLMRILYNVYPFRNIAIIRRWFSSAKLSYLPEEKRIFVKELLERCIDPGKVFVALEDAQKFIDIMDDNERLGLSKWEVVMRGATGLLSTVDKDLHRMKSVLENIDHGLWDSHYLQSLIVYYLKIGDMIGFRTKIQEILQDRYSPEALLMNERTSEHPLHRENSIICLADLFLNHSLFFIFSRHELQSTVIRDVKSELGSFIPILPSLLAAINASDPERFAEAEPFLVLFTRCFFGHFEWVDMREACQIICKLESRANLKTILEELYGDRFSKVRYLTSNGTDPDLITAALFELHHESSYGH